MRYDLVSAMWCGFGSAMWFAQWIYVNLKRVSVWKHLSDLACPLVPPILINMRTCLGLHAKVRDKGVIDPSASSHPCWDHPISTVSQLTTQELCVSQATYKTFSRWLHFHKWAQLNQMHYADVWAKAVFIILCHWDFVVVYYSAWSLH